MLAQTFYWYILAVYESRAQSLVDAPTPYCWLTIRHVCRAWRTVALFYPRLSTHICITRPDCIQELLRLSGSLPLYIYQLPGGPTDAAPSAVTQAFWLIIGHLSRVVSADFPPLGHDVFKTVVIQESGNRRASKLRSLSLHLPVGLPPGHPIFPRFEFPVLEDLSCRCGDALYLRDLFVPTLRRLELCRFDPVTIGDLVLLLEPLRQLEELVLKDTFQDGALDDISLDPQKIISFPRLKFLVLTHTRGEYVVDLLGRLRYPATTSIHLQYSYILNGQYYDAMLAMLRRKVRELDAPESLAVSTSSDNHVRVALWSKRQTLDDLRSNAWDSASFSLSVVLSCLRTTSDLIRCLPLGDVRSSLFMETARTFSSPRWTEVLASLPVLEDLMLDYELSGSTPALDDLDPQYLQPLETAVSIPKFKMVKLLERYHERSVVTVAAHIPSLHHVAQALLASHQRDRAGVPDYFDLSRDVISFDEKSVCVCGIDSSQTISSDNVSTDIGDPTPEEIIPTLSCFPWNVFRSALFSHFKRK